MSFQPQMPIVNQPPPPPPISAPLPPVAPPAKGKRRKGLLIFGLILFVGGILGGGAVVAKGMSNYKEAVKSLARAPVGCTTTLVFDKPAKFTIYAETKGKLSELSGDCEANGGSYEHPGDKLPKLSLTLVDSSGEEVDLERGVTATYDVDGYKGTGVRTMQITEAGTYRLNVESDDSDFAIAIGKNPKDDNDLMLVIGGSIALGGIVLGLLFFLLGLRRRRPSPALASTGPAPLPGWPAGQYPGMAPTGPPTHQGFRPEPPPVTQPTPVPGQPPVRLPDTSPGGTFAPPTFAPPSSPDIATGPPTVVQPPTAPPTLPTLPPTSPGVWTKPDDEE
jgi:hypothetical protein